MLHYRRSDHNLAASLEHDAIVGSQIRLALCSVQYEALGLLARRGAKLDMGREGCSAETYNSVELDFLKDSLDVFRNLSDKLVRKINAISPLVSFNIYLHMHHVVSGNILARSDRLNRTGH